MEKVEKVLQTIRPKMFKRAMYTLRNPVEAEDAVSNAILKLLNSVVWLELVENGDTERIYGYAVRAASNEAINYLRRNSGEIPSDPEYSKHIVCKESNRAVELLDEEHLYTALTKLTEQESRVVLLTAQGYSIKEIQAILGKSKISINRIKKNLRTRYKIKDFK